MDGILLVYTCPLCKATFKRYKWFMKHVQRYSEDDQKKIFFQGEKFLYQGKLTKFFNNDLKKED